MEKLYVFIEAPYGYIWEQEVEWREGESVNAAIRRYKRMLGKSYRICDWYIV